MPAAVGAVAAMAEYRSSGKELRKSPKGLFAGLFAVLLVALLGYGCWQVARNMVSLEPEPQTLSEPDLVVPIETTQQTEDPNQIIYAYEAAFFNEVHTGSLVLVNSENPIEDIETGLESVYDRKGEHIAVKDLSVKLLPQATDALNRMADAFFAATGHDDLLVYTGYRTKAEQQQLAGAAGGRPAAAAGCSDHETGLSFDLSIMQNGKIADFDGQGDYAWITQHCAEYGFILRYPADKTAITKSEAEPWHFRYVGEPHALYMKEHNLCLEEYLEHLRGCTYEGAHLALRDSADMLYEAYYVAATAQDETAAIEIPVPGDLPYERSGDNRVGFFVTVETGRSYSEYAATQTTAVPQTTTVPAQTPAPAVP